MSGPSEKATSPKVANAVNIIMLLFNILAMSYTLKGEWTWLLSLNILIGTIS